MRKQTFLQRNGLPNAVVTRHPLDLGKSVQSQPGSVVENPVCKCRCHKAGHLQVRVAVGRRLTGVLKEAPLNGGSLGFPRIVLKIHSEGSPGKNDTRSPLPIVALWPEGIPYVLNPAAGILHDRTLQKVLLSPLWPPKRFYRTPTKGSIEPQTSFYRTFASTPPFQIPLGTKQLPTKPYSRRIIFGNSICSMCTNFQGN